MKFLTRIVCLFVIANPVWALADDSQYWASAMLRKNLTDTPWYLGVEGVYRHSEEKKTSVVESIRLWSGYKLPSETELSVAYELRKTDQTKNNERRLILQAQHRWSFEDFVLQARYRQEARRFDDSETLQHRTRIQGRVEASAWNFWSSTPFYSAEWFYIHNDVAARKQASQELRNILGLSITPTEKMKFDVGYMDRRQTVPANGNTDESRYRVLNLSMTFKF